MTRPITRRHPSLEFMTAADQPNCASQPLAVGFVKSSRLQALREQAQAGTDNSGDPLPATQQQARDQSGLDADLLQVRQLIEQRLAEIMAVLPQGRQRRLFKIRFGVELDEIKQLPIKRVVKLLNLEPALLNILPAKMKRIAELNYNGDIAN